VRTISDILFPIFDHERRSIGIATEDGGMALCLFSGRRRAEAWLMNMELEQHIVGRGLNPQEMAHFCEIAKENGFAYWILNPPVYARRRWQMGTLDSLKEQAEAKA
jgi:hypothetical protein